jgi:polysaccharide pyruvyl transferase CsaB
MTRVLLSGYYGFGNFGDEALLDVIVEQMRRRFPAAQLEVLSATPNATVARCRVAAASRWDWREVRAAIGRADVVVSGGGGLLQNATSTRSLLYYAGIIREAIRKRRRTMIFAQSIGPLDMLGRSIVRHFCKGVDRATVRDERSRALAQRLLPSTPVERTADPVFLYDAQAENDLAGEGLESDGAAYAVVSVRRAAAFRDVRGIVSRVVDRLALHHDVRCAFLPLGGAPDAAASTDVIRACKSNPVLLPEAPLRKTAAILRGAHVVVGMRLHSLILAARYAVPFLAIAYDPKVCALCDDLKYPLEPLWKPGAHRLDDAAIDELTDRLVHDREAIAAHLARQRSSLQSAAERNFDVLGELLSD